MRVGCPVQGAIAASCISAVRNTDFAHPSKQGADSLGSLMPQIVVITGAGAGVGRAVAEEFGRHGWSVALLSRDSHPAEYGGC